jgi:hypothetical protein
MATNLVLGSVVSIWAAAPVPRPPHPINATLITSLPSTYAVAETVKGVDNIVPASKEELFMNFLRLALRFLALDFILKNFVEYFNL